MNQEWLRQEWQALQSRRPELADVELEVVQIEDEEAPPDLWIMAACCYGHEEKPGPAGRILIDPILRDTDALVALTHEAAHAIVGHEADHDDSFWQAYDALVEEWIAANVPGSFRGVLYAQTDGQRVEIV